MFLAAYHGAFQLDASEAASFVATRVDVEPGLGMSHVILQRQFNGIPVFHGGIQIEMDAGSNIVRATADERFHVGVPSNAMMLSAAEAAGAAARAFGVPLALSARTVDGLATTFTSPTTLDPGGTRRRPLCVPGPPVVAR